MMKKLLLFFFIISIGVSTWGQAYNEGYPSVTNITETTIALESSINIKGYTAFVILPSTSPNPSALQIAYGHDSNDQPVVNKGEIKLTGSFGYIIGTPNDINIAGLTPNTSYKAHFASYNTDYELVFTEDPISISFTTATALTPPTIISRTPADNELNAPIDQDLILTFNEDIVIGTSGSFTIHENGTSSTSYPYGSGNVNVAANTLTITHSAFKNATDYYITIDAGFVKSATSGADFGGISNSTDWNFTTTAANPQWISGFPLITPPTKTEVVVNGQVDKAGSYYLVLTQSATTPSADEIKLGTDASVLIHNTGAVTANTTFSKTLNITGLSSETEYWVHMVTEDGAGKFSSVQSLFFTTQDTRTPAYVEPYPVASIIDGTSALLEIATDEDGLCYWLILPSTATAPLPDQVKLGRDANNDPVESADTYPLFAGDPTSVFLLGLDYNTSYVAYIVSTDNNDNDIETTTATAVPFTTPAAPPTITGYLPVRNDTEVAIDQSLQLTFSENIQFVAGSEATISIRRSSNGSQVVSYDISNENVTIAGATLTIGHVLPFAENTSYYVTMGDGFVESVATGSDFGGISETTDWTFTTETLPAQWATGFPNLQNQTKTGLDVIGNADENGTYYLVVTNSSTTPTAEQVKGGLDHTGTLASLASTAAVIAGSNFTDNLDITALASETDYWVYIVIEDAGNRFSELKQLPFTTFETTWAATYPTYQNLSHSNIDILGQVNANGNYYIVISNSDIAPLDAQVKDGFDHTGSPALLKATDVVTANTEFTSSLDISDLSTQSNYWAYIVVEDASSNFTTVEPIPFTTVQASWTATYPNIQNHTKTSLDVHGQVDHAGQYYLVLTQSATTPTEDQIIAATDDTGATALFASNAPVSANSEFVATVDLSSMASETDYWIHMLVQDTYDNYTPIAQIAFKQLDTQAPVYTAPTPIITTITGTAATLEVKTNEAGRVYYVILPASAPAPSITQVIEGKDASDTPMPAYADFRDLSSNSLMQITKDNYTSQTSYIAYIVTRDNNENYIETENPTPVPFTTDDTTAPAATFDPSDQSVDVAIDKTITITFSEEIYNSSAELITSANVASIISLRENDPTGTAVLATITYDDINFVITIDPNNSLKELQVYNINLAELRDISGNVLAASNTVFTTKDLTPPLTIFEDPADGATNRSIGSPIVINFDEAIRKLDGTAINDTDLQTLINFNPATTFTANINTDNKLITIYPSPYLAASTLYTLTVNPVEDVLGNEQIAASSISFTTADFNTWEGKTDDNFLNPSNYTGAYSNGASVLVKAGSSLMTIKANATLPNLIIEPLASVTIQAGVTLSVSEELTLKSDATGTGSLIINGSISITNSKINIEQNITDANQYEFISSPVQSATPANVGADGAIYNWNNVTGNWMSFDPNSSFSPLSGYILKSSNSLLYKGALNRGAFSIDVKGTPKNSGFTLVGNPYTAAIDWDLITEGDRALVENKFWMFIDGVYGIYDPGTLISTDLVEDASLIPSSHAFWVKAANWELGQTVTGTLSVNESYLAHNHTSYLKSTNNTRNAIPHIKLAGIHNGVKCEKAIGFKPDASEHFEQYDTERFFGFTADAIELYSVVDNKKLAINTYPELINNMIIPLGYKTQKSGTFTIQLQDIVKIENGIQILLTDHQEGITVDLNNSEPYVFTSSAINTSDRFSLELIGNISTDIAEKQQGESVDIYAVKQTVYIQVKNLKNPAYKIYDINGKLIKAGNLNAESLNQIHLNNSKGILIVKVIGDEQATSKKVIIN